LTGGSEPRQTVLYPVNELIIGGSEQQLLELVRGLDKTLFRPVVAPLYPGGALTPEFLAVPGVEVVELRRAGRFDPSPFYTISRLLGRRRVSIVQPFLSPSTVFGLLPALGLHTPVTVLTERCGVRRFRRPGARLYAQIEARLARLVDVVVPNSEAGRDLAIQRGIPAAKVEVIYNGLNLDRLQPDPEAVARIRAQLGVPAEGKVIGILATLKPAKDHVTFLRAAAELSRHRTDLRFAIIGDGPRRAELEQLALSLGLVDRLAFFGFQRDVASYLAACDILACSSRDNEGHSNSILEAMGLGLAVVATDVGGNRELLEHGQTGMLVSIGDSVGLARAIERLVAEPEFARTLAARGRSMVHERFGLDRMIAAYQRLYWRLLNSKGLLRAGDPPSATTAALHDGTGHQPRR
jgi:glycosyltransferase involved in cell wall biosynthesis